MFLRIKTVIFALLAMMAVDVVTTLAQGNDALFDAPWRAFGTGDFPTFIPDFFDVGDIDGGQQGWIHRSHMTVANHPWRGNRVGRHWNVVLPRIVKLRAARMEVATTWRINW